MRVPSGRDNAYDLIRLVLALTVLETHLNLYIGNGPEWLSRFTKDHVTAGEFGVLGFFGLSGFLISTSCADLLCKPRGWLTFVRRRFFRIMPGFWACLIITATVVAPFLVVLYHRPLSSYDFWQVGGGWDYVRTNWWLLIRRYDITGVLNTAPYGAINGNLWSLFPEVVCYGATLGMAALGLFGKNRWMAPALVGFLVALNIINQTGPNHFYGPTAIVLNRWYYFFCAYFVGATFYCYREKFLLADWRKTVFSGFLILFLLKFGGTYLAAPLLVPLFLLSAGQLFTVRMRYDLSYGLYIYGSPALQIVTAIPLLRSHYSIYVISGVLLSFLMAFMSWVLIERPCMRIERKVLEKPFPVSSVT
ncbi:MAG TPA: acyltransferase [Opitutaceae bacterium]|nr:acyltransferase [Opitutaceae bacterium]